MPWLTAIPNVTTAVPNDNINLKVFHEILNADGYTYGIGLKVIYNPAFVEFDSKTSTFRKDDYQQLEYLDHDPDAHSITMGWNRVTAAWPGTFDPLELLNLNFKVKADAQAGEAVFRVETTQSTFTVPAIDPVKVTIVTSSNGPAAPKITQVDKASDSITLHWEPQNGLSHYILEYKEAKEQSWASDLKLGASATTQKIPGLKADTDYTFRLTAVNDNGSQYAETNAKTTSSVTVNPPVTPTFTVSTTSNSATLSWSFQNGLTHYVLEYKKDASSPKSVGGFLVK